MSISASSEQLYLPGKRWRRERREVALWAVIPFVLGYGVAFLVSPLPYPLAFLSFGGAVLLLMAAVLALVFPYTRGPYQALRLEGGRLQIEERQRQQIVALEGLTDIKAVLVRPRARNRPARYELQLLAGPRTLVATINANAFEAAQIQELLEHLRAQCSGLRVDLTALAPGADA